MNGTMNTKQEPCNKTTLAVVGAVAIGTAVALAMLFGGCATEPTKFERTLFTTITNYVPQTVLQTNVVERTVDVPRPVTVYQTNEEHQVTVSYVTNLVRQVFNETNIIPVTVTNAVVTLGPNTATADTAKTLVGTAGNVISPGAGTLAGLLIAGALGLWREVRNRRIIAAAAGANATLSASGAALTQIIETGREIMAKTPQGEKLADLFTNWMKTHQAQTNTISAITQIVKQSVDNGDAKDAADQILALMGEGTAKKS